MLSLSVRAGVGNVIADIIKRAIAASRLYSHKIVIWTIREIAGVVNVITKSDFEGLDFSYQFTTSDETNTGDAHNFEVLWGAQGDRGGIVVAASILDREEINISDNFDRYGGTTVSLRLGGGGVGPSPAYRAGLLHRPRTDRGGAAFSGPGVAGPADQRPRRTTLGQPESLPCAAGRVSLWR